MAGRLQGLFFLYSDPSLWPAVKHSAFHPLTITGLVERNSCRVFQGIHSLHKLCKILDYGVYISFVGDGLLLSKLVFWQFFIYKSCMYGLLSLTLFSFPSTLSTFPLLFMFFLGGCCFILLLFLFFFVLGVSFCLLPTEFNQSCLCEHG